ncbi:MAG: hypothetical protein FWG04_02550 [Desulfovibrionaceae bacterium]|nr:hypothetical protein [Desulfovibrionaceae bacterium]
MTKVYLYDASGYFAGVDEDHGLLPNNATRTAPEVLEGFIPRWNGEAWEQEEDHKGEQGWVNGEPHTIIEYGPLPSGWSADPPPQPFHPGPDYDEQEDGAWVRVRFTRKDFMLWCGLDKLILINAAIAEGNPTVKTVHDLLMAAEFISIKDADTVQMAYLLATPEGGSILTPADVARILAGQEYREPGAAA